MLKLIRVGVNFLLELISVVQYKTSYAMTVHIILGEDQTNEIKLNKCTPEV